MCVFAESFYASGAWWCRFDQCKLACLDIKYVHKYGAYVMYVCTYVWYADILYIFMYLCKRAQTSSVRVWFSKTNILHACMHQVCLHAPCGCSCIYWCLCIYISWCSQREQMLDFDVQPSWNHICAWNELSLWKMLHQLQEVLSCFCWRQDNMKSCFFISLVFNILRSLLVSPDFSEQGNMLAYACGACRILMVAHLSIILMYLNIFADVLSCI